MRSRERLGFEPILEIRDRLKIQGRNVEVSRSTRAMSVRAAAGACTSW